MLVPYARKNHTVSNFNPFHDFDELERAFFSDNALSEFKTDIQEDGDNFVLEADLPGFKKEDIHRRPSDRHRRAAFQLRRQGQEEQICPLRALLRHLRQKL